MDKDMVWHIVAIKKQDDGTYVYYARERSRSDAESLNEMSKEVNFILQAAQPKWLLRTEDMKWQQEKNRTVEDVLIDPKYKKFSDEISDSLHGRGSAVYGLFSKHDKVYSIGDIIEEGRENVIVGTRVRSSRLPVNG